MGSKVAVEIILVAATGSTYSHTRCSSRSPPCMDVAIVLSSISNSTW